ncbi:ArsC family reductase [Noviherbaspirillum sedimenti]|uniref:ArsC family reductase n=1 Tax=Noviherbaspirillum sedimenti TaxID=2320865 RepID=A0A3A3FXA5_9BURK|nr:ArsC family reductase [Noviherbaspirillum sedimenti]RJG00848.1 ArsC family reductase [Noviherbaspirillum sedimenti]
MSITLYGIPNCDTVKKARTWLDARGIPYVFHDFKKAGISEALVSGWLRDVAWDVLVNRKGTTWRGLDEARKESIFDAASATTLMLEAPSIVKRPVLVKDGRTHVGFADASYQHIFEKP